MHQPGEGKQANENGTKAWAETRVVVAGPTPHWETVSEKVVIPLATRTAQDRSHETQSGKALGRELLRFFAAFVFLVLVGV